MPADEHEGEPDQHVQHIVRERPAEILDRRQSQHARQRLVKIDQSETKVEHTRQPIVVGHRYHEPNSAEEDVKEVVRCGAAREAISLRYYKSGDAYQYEDWREDRECFLIEGFSFHRNNRPLDT